MSYLARVIRQHWFLFALGLVLVVGLGASASFGALVKRIPSPLVIAAVMFTTALPVDLVHALARRSTWLAAGLAIMVSVFVAPLLAWGVYLILTRVELLPSALAAGLVITAILPCTIASATVWTRRGNGSEAVPIVTTLVTNLLSFLVVPTWAVLLLSSVAPIDFGKLALTLLVVVVAPVIVAQLARLSGGVRGVAERHAKGLSALGQIGVLVMVLVGAVDASQALARLDHRPTAWDWVLVAIAATGIHLALFAVGWLAAGLLRLSRPEQLGVALAGSQKTLTVGLGAALAFGGLAIVPLVIYHVAQLLVDTWLVDQLRTRNGPRREGS